MLQHRHLFTLTILFVIHQSHTYQVALQDIGIANRKTYQPEHELFYNDDGYDTYHRSDQEQEKDTRLSNNQKIVSSQKTKTENGWKPIIGSRTTEQTSDMKHASQLQKLRERYLDYLNSKTETIPTTTETLLKWEHSVSHEFPKTSWDYNVNSKIYVGANKNSTLSRDVQSTTTEKYVEIFKEPAEKKPKMLKEDDIMWMHYGSPSKENVQRYQPTTEAQTEKTTTTVNPIDMKYEDRGEEEKKNQDWLEYGLQYFLNLSRDRLKKSPKNIYEIIDKNNRDDFKPIVGINKRHTPKPQGDQYDGNRKSDNYDRLIKSAEAPDDDSFLDLYKAIYGPDNGVNENEENDFTKSYTMGGFMDNLHNQQNIDSQKSNEQKYYKEDSDQKSADTTELNDSWWVSQSKEEKREKSGKFLGKPIIITEPHSETRFTTEYYRKLFDSFGGHDNNYKGNTKKNLVIGSEPNSTKEQSKNSLKDYYTLSPKSYSPAEERANLEKQDSISIERVLSDSKKNCSSKTERKNRNIISDKSENLSSSEKIKENKIKEAESSGVLEFIGIDMNELVPRTLRTNILLIKRLIVECYLDYENEQNLNSSTGNCLKKMSLRVLDNAVNSEIIKITDSVSLVKDNSTDLSSEESSPRSNLMEVEWLPNILEKVVKLFSTHSLKVQLMNPQEKFQVEGRRRHQFRRIFPVVAGIYMTITAVLIPLFFQFMAMLGGKSFVVSKIALIIAVFTSIGRRRHYRRVFPIMVGAYMILSTVLIPLGFKFMTLLGAKSLLVSKLSLIIALMGGIKKIFGFGADLALQSPYSALYPTAYPPVYPSYYDPWRRDEYRKISHYDEPTEYSHYSEEIE